MITYLTKQFQAVPALASLYRRLGGQFVTTRYSTANAIRKYSSDFKVFNYNEKFSKFSKGYNYLNNASVILTGAPSRRILHKFDALKYMVFTGTTAIVSAEQFHKDHSHFDSLFVIGPRMMRVVTKANLDKKALHSGYLPFLDFPKARSNETYMLLKNAGIDIKKRIVLYLPRGEPFGSLDSMLPRLIEQAPHADINLIVRPHPSQSVKLHFKDRVRLLLWDRSIAKSHNVFLDLNYFKLADLLSVADLVLSDGNSPAEESLFYDVPQMLVESKKLSRKTIADSMKNIGASQEDIDSALQVYGTGPIITEEDKDFVQLIHDALESSKKFKIQRDEHYSFVFGEKGLSAQHQLIANLKSGLNSC